MRPNLMCPGGFRSFREISIYSGDSDPFRRFRSFWEIQTILGDSDPSGRFRSFWEIPVLLGDSGDFERLRFFFGIPQSESRDRKIAGEYVLPCPALFRWYACSLNAWMVCVSPYRKRLPLNQNLALAHSFRLLKSTALYPHPCAFIFIKYYKSIIGSKSSAVASA